MYFYPEESAKVVKNVGMRACIGVPILMFPTRWADPEEYFTKGQQLAHDYKDDKLITVSWAPHSPYATTDEQLLRIKTLCEDTGLICQMHVHETEGEVKLEY